MIEKFMYRRANAAHVKLLFLQNSTETMFGREAVLANRQICRKREAARARRKGDA